MADIPRPQPTEVFTPSALPLQQHNAYVHRTGTEESIRRFLSRGQIPLVFGEYGVGKTTVVRKVLRELGLEPNLTYIATTAQRTLSDIFSMALEKLSVTITTSETTTGQTQADIGATFIVNASGSATHGVQTVRESVVKAPTSKAVIDILAHNHVVLVIDELHRCTPNFRQDLTDFLKASHGQESTWPNVILIGTTSDAASLVRTDPGIDRFVKELYLSPMTRDESVTLIRTGFSTLGISIRDAIVDRAVRTAAGAPSLIQSVSLDMAESCIMSGRTEVLDEDYRAAVENYFRENGKRLLDTYTKAIEHTGEKRYRKQILLAMSAIEADFPELEQIRQEVERRLNTPVPQTALSGPLRALKSGPDSILVDIKRQEGARIHNVSTFRDPMMKSFIRSVMEAESQGLL